MGCSSCSSGKGGTPSGCGDKGHCSTGGCNKMNTYDWINTLDIEDPTAYNIVEVSFKKGSRKSFFLNEPRLHCITGDVVVVDSESGYDVGQITLSGELVRLQMKKKRFSEEKVIHKVIRRANVRDLEKLEEARALEHKTLVKSRVIARTMGLDMKIGDIEYQGDKRKATFYYTAEGRVDFRELVRSYAREFRVKIEMRQIGSRQESGRIGGIGACGRELCCSTWLSNFSSVSTTAARYQNISINQTKLSGQCGRLKCCLNYELDMYVEALSEFPKDLDYLELRHGRANHIKTDIFKGLMYFAVPGEKGGRGPIIAVTKERVWEVLEMNKKGKQPDTLQGKNPYVPIESGKKEPDLEFADVTGEIELPELKRRKKRRGPRRSGNRRLQNKSGQRKQSGPRNKKTGNKPSNKKTDSNPNNKTGDSKPKSRPQSKRKPRPGGNASKPNPNTRNKSNPNTRNKPNSDKK